MLSVGILVREIGARPILGGDQPQAQRLVMAHVSFDRFEADLRAPRARGSRARAKGGAADT